MKLIHAKARFTEDIQYARHCLRLIEAGLRSGDWEEISDVAMEMEGLISSLRSYADDNHHGIEQSHCLPAWEIAEIKAARGEVA
jgi:hemerythrin-like domain-containing protein